MYLTIYPNGNIYTNTFIHERPKNPCLKAIEKIRKATDKYDFALFFDKNGKKPNRVASQILGSDIKGSAIVCLARKDLNGKYSFYPMPDETARFFLMEVLDEELISGLRSSAIITDKIINRINMKDKV